MAYELKELGWYDEDIKSISSSISGQVMTITITLQSGNTLDTTVTLPEVTGAKVTNISNAIVNNKLTTTVTLSDGNSVTSEAVDLPTVNISGKQDKEINLTGFTAKTVEEALTEAKAASETASTNLTAHIDNKENPHGVTAAQVGLGNVTNTSDADKPVSTAQQTALDKKLDKVTTGSILPQAYVKNSDGSQGVADYIPGVFYFNYSGTFNLDDFSSVTITDGWNSSLVGEYYRISPCILSIEQLKGGPIESLVYGVTLKSIRNNEPDSVEFVGVVGYFDTYYNVTIVVDVLGTIREVGIKKIENAANKVTAITGTGNDTEYPTTKATYTYGQNILIDAKNYTDNIVGDINTLLADLDTGSGV